MTIWIEQNGTIELDGHVADLEAVERALAELKHRRGAVLYGRDATAHEPHPNGMRVLQMVIGRQLPVRLSTRRDFSDALVSEGLVSEAVVSEGLVSEGLGADGRNP